MKILQYCVIVQAQNFSNELREYIFIVNSHYIYWNYKCYFKSDEIEKHLPSIINQFIYQIFPDDILILDSTPIIVN